MRPLLAIFAAIWRAERGALLRGIALAWVVLAMGIALLGLSGWFIVAAGAAGLAGTGAVFDVFRPSAGVRFLALGRTAARYGERLLTHDATLRALAALRVRLLAGIAAAPFATMSRFRGAQVLNRLTTDIDALDGIALRLAIPLIAGVTAAAGAWAALAWLVAPVLANWSVLSLALGSAAALAWAGRRSARPSRRGAAATQAFRSRLIDHLRGRAMLAFADRHAASRAHVLHADGRARGHALEVAAIERRAGAAVAIAATLAAAGALLIGAELARAGALAPAQASLGFFATLAMAEIVAPLRRGMAELGGMRDAARRVSRWLGPPAPPAPPSAPMTVPHTPCGLAVEGVSICLPEAPRPILRAAHLSVAPGETVALSGRSGCGKSTLLNAAAGLIAVSAGEILVDGRAVTAWNEAGLRTCIGYLPQRSALIGGTIAGNLRLGCPEASDADLWQVLEQVCLSGTIARMGGLGATLGEGGAGLSGGETRRMALARVLLRRPRVLLLDEPTEGLDRATAESVLAGVRRACPGAAILVAAHRPVEHRWADRIVALK